MAIDVRREQLLTFARAAKRIPRRRAGRPVHSSTLWRWAKKGVRCGDGRVFLEFVRLPSGMFTSAQAIERFVGRLNDLPSTNIFAGPTRQQLSTVVSELDREKI